MTFEHTTGKWLCYGLESRCFSKVGWNFIDFKRFWFQIKLWSCWFLFMRFVIGRIGKFILCEILHRCRSNRYLRWISPIERKRKRFNWKEAGFRFCMPTLVKIIFLTLSWTPQTAHRFPNGSLNRKGITGKVRRVCGSKRGKLQGPVCPFRAFGFDEFLRTQFQKT